MQSIFFKRYQLYHGKEYPFVIKVMVKFVMVMVKVFVKVPSFVYVRDAHKPYQISTSAPADDGVITGCIKTYASINTGNLFGPLLDGKVRAVGMNATIVTTPGSNVGICFAVPMNRIKPDVEYILLTDSLLRRGEGTNF